jgi:hypothetical protein
MSAFQLIASLVGSLAWPFVVLSLSLLAWLKRADIMRLLTDHWGNPSRPLRRFRAGPLEFEWWDKVIGETADTVASIAPAPTPQESEKTPLEIDAASSPAAVVLEAFAKVENSLRQLLTAAGRPSAGGIAALSQDAQRNGLITDEVFDAIYNLNRLRSAAAKRVGSADISADQAKEYMQLASRVLTAIQQATEAVSAGDTAAATDEGSSGSTRRRRSI